MRGERASKWSQRTTGIQREGDRVGCEAHGGVGVGEDEENGEMRDVEVSSKFILTTAHIWYYTATIWSHTEQQ